MNSDTDNEEPEDVAFSEARTSAVQRTQAESKKAREIKEKRKAVITKKQAWFRESKVDADRKRNTDVTATQEPSKDPLGSALKASVKQKSKNTSTDKIKKINLERISVEDDQSDLEEDQMAVDPSKVSLAADVAPLVERGKGVRVVSLKRTGRQFGAWRTDAAKFAQERFNPPGVPRISAAKWNGIVAKRNATRTPR